MSRLDSIMRRLAAQRDGLEWATERTKDMPGDALDMGLGNGRTYDHMREISDRRIWVIDRVLQCPGYMILCDNILKCLWSELSCKYLITHRQSI